MVHALSSALLGKLDNDELDWLGPGTGLSVLVVPVTTTAVEALHACQGTDELLQFFCTLNISFPCRM